MKVHVAATAAALARGFEHNDCNVAAAPAGLASRRPGDVLGKSPFWMLAIPKEVADAICELVCMARSFSIVRPMARNSRSQKLLLLATIMLDPKANATRDGVSPASMLWNWHVRARMLLMLLDNDNTKKPPRAKQASA